MSKADLVNYIAAATGLTKADATRALEAMMSGVIKGLKENGKVTLTGFCTFAAKNKPAKDARNPRTGESVEVDAKNAVKCKFGKTIKGAVNA